MGTCQNCRKESSGWARFCPFCQEALITPNEWERKLWSCPGGNGQRIRSAKPDFFVPDNFCEPVACGSWLFTAGEGHLLAYDFNIAKTGPSPRLATAEQEILLDGGEELAVCLLPPWILCISRGEAQPLQGINLFAILGIGQPAAPRVEILSKGEQTRIGRESWPAVDIVHGLASWTFEDELYIFRQGSHEHELSFHKRDGYQWRSPAFDRRGDIWLSATSGEGKADIHQISVKQRTPIQPLLQLEEVETCSALSVNEENQVVFTVGRGGRVEITRLSQKQGSWRTEIFPVGDNHPGAQQRHAGLWPLKLGGDYCHPLIEPSAAAAALGCMVTNSYQATFKVGREL